MIQERTITLTGAISCALWISTAIIIACGTVCAFTVGHHDRGLAASMSLMSIGLALSAGAATVTIRNMIHSQNCKMEDAFRLGQETGPLRRVGRS